jgi:histidyl-tRNA synthetase
MTELGQTGAVDGPDCYLVNVGEAATRMAQTVAETLRDGGLSVVLHSGGGSFKSQMKKADASAARYAIILGDDEVAAGEVNLKALRGMAWGDTQQQRVTLPVAVDLIKQGVINGNL